MGIVFTCAEDFEAVLVHVVGNLHALCARCAKGEDLSEAENAEFTNGRFIPWWVVKSTVNCKVEVQYLRNCFLRLDVDYIRRSMMELVSFKLWRHLTEVSI